MKKIRLILILLFYISINKSSSQSLTRCYSYDASGNRTQRVGPCAAAIVVKDKEELPHALIEFDNNTNKLTLTDNNVSENNAFDLKVYPVPTSSKIYFLIKGYTENAKWTLYNAIGHIIQNGRNNLREIDLSTYPTGSYFFRLEEDDHVSIKQILLLND